MARNTYWQAIMYTLDAAPQVLNTDHVISVTLYTEPTKADWLLHCLMWHVARRQGERGGVWEMECVGGPTYYRVPTERRLKGIQPTHRHAFWGHGMFRFSSDMQGRESLYVGLYVVEISEPFSSCLYTHTCNVWREWHIFRTQIDTGNTQTNYPSALTSHTHAAY